MVDPLYFITSINEIFNVYLQQTKSFHLNYEICMTNNLVTPLIYTHTNNIKHDFAIQIIFH